jgi:hypothetical protein
MKRLAIAAVGLALVVALAACTRTVEKVVVVTPSPAGTPTFTVEESAYVEAVATAQGEATAEALVHASETVAAMPTSTPHPTPKPYYDLKLISFNWHHEYGYATVEGFVENESGKRLENIEAVAIFLDAGGTPIASESGVLEYGFLLPGQQSPFTVMATYNPAMEKCRVEFKEFSGGMLETDYTALP